MKVLNFDLKFIFSTHDKQNIRHMDAYRPYELQQNVKNRRQTPMG